jgi:AraC-like DNA-binding protein
MAPAGKIVVPSKSRRDIQCVLASGSGWNDLPGDIHLGVAREIVPVLRDFGVDPDAVIRQAGLRPHLFDNGLNVIPIAALGTLLAACKAHSRCPHFGLLVGGRGTILSLGILGRLMQHSETVGDALRSLVSNLSRRHRGIVPSLSGGDRVVAFNFSLRQPDLEGADQILDGGLAFAVNALRSLIGAEWKPKEVLLPHERPENPDPYRRHFQAPARFAQRIAAIVFPAGDLDWRIAKADPLIREMLEDRIRQIRGSSRSELSDDVRRLLQTRLINTRCSAEEIADLLAMHRRTLSRRLKGSGDGYRAITNETRFEIARQLLEHSEVPLGHIAAALGYSEASAFTRAFRRWSGRTPTAWRADDHPT